ncbi:hypothetical protein EDC02_6142 [Micromonospora sp. Llam0]|uniref:hypothetical protein n=1 Tax=Micromonospora sp. Llam0 TaxID=2485143 RepID=UPI000FBD1009|nr:hypothetical protein [Micromonospora sp. Llam0]ROO51270.1 hypothetical protein EDC02_6142 [Micromonospora sp. Llam0]
MPPPTPATDPHQRRPDDIADAATYRPSDRVWVWPPHTGQWRPGVVEARSNLAVLVTYQRPGGGTSVDSLLPHNVMARTEPAADLDGTSSRPIRLRDVRSLTARSAAPA